MSAIYIENFTRSLTASPQSFIGIVQRALARLPRSTYYYHLERDKVDKYGAVRREIREIFAENRQRYGHRRVALALREKGVALNRKTVLRLMREMGLQGKVRRRKYRSYRGEAGKSAPNLLRRDFKAAGPFEKLATDVTEFAVCGAKVYLSPVMDLYNNEIVSHSVSTRADFAQTRRCWRDFSRGSRGARLRSCTPTGAGSTG